MFNRNAILSATIVSFLILAATFAAASGLTEATVDPTFTKGGSAETYNFSITNNNNLNMYYIKITTALNGFSNFSNITCPTGWGINTTAIDVECLGNPNPNGTKFIAQGDTANIGFTATPTTVEGVYNWTVYSEFADYTSDTQSPTTTVDKTAPATTISPDGFVWTNANAPFTLTCVENSIGSGCKNTYFTIIDSGDACPAQGSYSSGNNGTVTCANNSVCQKKVCYYSADALSNTETTKTSDIFQIDKQDPTTTDDAPAEWKNSDQTVTLTPNDNGGSGLANTLYCIDTTDTCAPGTSGTTANVACLADNVCVQYVRYYSTDTVGNIEAPKTTGAIQIDRANPIVGQVYVNPTIGGYTSSNPTISATINDAGSGVQSCQYTINGADWLAADWIAPNCSKTLAGLTDGQKYQFNLKGIDGVSNEDAGTAEERTVDGTGPVISNITITGTSESGNWKAGTLSISAIVTDTTAEVANVTFTLYASGSLPSGYCNATLLGENTYVCSIPASELNGNGYYIEVQAADNAGNPSTGESTGFNIDNTAPITEKTIGEPKSGNYLTSGTTITLTAIDGGADVHKICYSINDSNPTCTESNSIIITPFESGGQNSISFWAVDNLGNEETHTTQTHYVDDTKPITTIAFGTPQYTEDDTLWITTATQITLNATDSGVGVNETKYRIYLCDGTAGEWNTYDESFNIAEESCHMIEFHSVDELGNTETVNTKQVYVDDTAPVATKDVGEPNIFWNEITDAADRIIALQNGDGSWDWDVTNQTSPTGTTYLNIAGVTAEVLLDAYKLTGEPKYLDAAKKAGNYLITQISDPSASQRQNAFSIVFLYHLADATGNTQYSDQAHAILTHILHEENYWSTHNGNNCTSSGCTAPQLLAALKNYRGEQGNPAGIVAWDLFSFIEAAQIADETGFASNLATEINNYVGTFNSSTNYYDLGLSAAVIALGRESINYSSYMTALLTEQEADGSFSNAGSEHVQTTAYALMALEYAGETDAASAAAFYLVDNSGYSGIDNGWLEDDDEEYSEVTSEAAQAIYDIAAKEGIWIKNVTPITLTCTDQEPHPVGNEAIKYRRYQCGEEPGAFVTYGDPFTITEDSCHIVEYYCYDALGNTTGTDTETFIVDTSAPTTTSSIEDNSYITPDTEIELSAVDGGLHSVGVDKTYYRWYACNGPAGDFVTYTEPFKISEQCCHKLEFYSTDLLGNEESVVVMEYSIDGSAPTAGITGITGLIKIDEIDYAKGTIDYAKGTIEIDASVGDDKCLASYELKLCDNDGETCSTVVSGSEGFDGQIATLDTTELENGEYLLKLSAVDCAGNESSVSRTFYADNEAPVTQVTSPDPVIAGEDEVSVDFEVEWNGTDDGSGIAENGFALWVKDSLAEWVSWEPSNVSGAGTYSALYNGTIGHTYCFKSRAIDKLGNEEADKVGDEGVSCTGVAAYSYDIELKQGWNLISTPVVPLENNVENVFADIAENTKAVWAYDPLDPNAAETDGWLVYNPAEPETSNLETVTSGYGYWVDMKNDDRLNVSGTVMPVGGGSVPPQRALIPGWNLIGHYGVDSRNAGISLQSVYSRWVQPLRGYENGKFFKIYTSGNMNPGYGYWVAITSDLPETVVYIMAEEA